MERSKVRVAMEAMGNLGCLMEVRALRRVLQFACSDLLQLPITGLWRAAAAVVAGAVVYPLPPQALPMAGVAAVGQGLMVVLAERALRVLLLARPVMLGQVPLAGLVGLEDFFR
jgi:hypothetical protein